MLKEYRCNLSDSSFDINIKFGCANIKRKNAKLFTPYMTNCRHTLGDYVNVYKGKVITEEDVVKGKIPVVAGGKGPAYYNNEYNEEKNVITVSASGAYSGYVNYWDENIWASDCCVIRPKDNKILNCKFLYYLLKLIQDDIYLLQTGTDQPHVYSDDLAKIPFDISIEIEKQNEFVKRITKLEKEYTYNKKLLTKGVSNIINSVLEKELGIKSKNNKGKIQYINDTLFEISLYQNQRISHHNRYNTEVFTSFKNNIEWKPITDVFDTKGGKRMPKGSQFSLSDTSYKYLRPAELNNLTINYDNVPSIEKDIFDKIKNYTVNIGDFVVSNVGTLGKTAFIENNAFFNNNDVAMSENFIKLTPKIKVNEKFYSYYFMSDIFLIQLEKEYTITTIKKLGIDKIKNILIPDISPKTMQKIVKLIDSNIKNLNTIEKRLYEIEKDMDKNIKTFLKKQPLN